MDDAGWVRPVRNNGYVTDGPFFHKTESGKLLMGWSSFGDKGYAIGTAVSASEKIHGPWEHTDKLIFAEDGGHGMLFHAFDGELMLTFHQPNTGPHERAQIYRVEEQNDRLVPMRSRYIDPPFSSG